MTRRPWLENALLILLCGMLTALIASTILDAVDRRAHEYRFQSWR